MEQAHGVLVDVLGVGVLLVGPSGIGKSECALELVRRGHRLIADDVVRLERRGEALFGASPEIIRHTLEIRGIGILYVPDLYGAGAVADEARIDLLCRLEEWNERSEFERVGLERQREVWDGVELPRLTLPARPGAHMATLIEAGARDHELRKAGLETGAARVDARMRGEREKEPGRS